MKQIYTNYEVKQFIKQCQEEGKDEIDILTNMHIIYLKRFISKKQLGMVAKMIGWKMLPNTEKVTLEEKYSMGFRLPKERCKTAGLPKKACLTIEHCTAVSDEEPFDDID